MKRLEGRVAVVTGAGSGIGRATSLALARRGCHLALVDVDEGGAIVTAGVVRAAGVRASTHVVDVADAEAMGALADAVVDEHGGANILVNNAGVTSAGRFVDEPLDDLRWIVGINLWGVVHGCHAFLPVLLGADEGHIVNLSSMVGLLGMPQNGAYSLTKGAVRSFSESLRAELRTSGIGVTSVHPGSIHTNITKGARGAEAERLARMGEHRLAAKLLTSPDVVADRIVRAIEQDRARAVVGVDAKVLDVVARVLPGRSGLIGRLTDRLT